MTESQPTPTPPVGSGEPDGDSVPLWVFGLLVVLLLVGGAVAANELLKLRKDTDPAAEKRTYPTSWDARVRPYVKIAEKQRGLRFRHPVEVEFLSDADFKKEVTAKEEDLTDEDREEIEHATGLLRAVGLISGDVDLFEEMNQLRGGAVIGLYSFEDERIRIRGTKLDPAVKLTLVHELTHALQDQHFRVGELKKEFEENDDSSGSSAFDALVEGDAKRVELEYYKSLSKKKRAAVDRTQAKGAVDASEQTAGVPEIFKTLLSSPYALGEAMLALAVKLDGNDAVDRLFRDPPSAEEHLLDPWTLIRDNQDPLDVDEPELEKGDDEFDSGDFGALGWFLVLAERLPLLDALDAVDGWGGDSYVAFERDGASCVRVDYRGDTKRDVTQMHAALKDWVGGHPGESASVRRDGSLLAFESCDPGKGAGAGKNASNAVIELALTRTYTALGVLAVQGEEMSRCFADRAVRVMEWEDPSQPGHGADDPAVQAKFQRIIARCGGIRTG